MDDEYKQSGSRLGQSSYSSYGAIPGGNRRSTYSGEEITEHSQTARTEYTRQFQQIIGKVTNNVQEINSSSSKLEHSARKIGSPDDSTEFREKMHMVQARTNDVIKETMGQLKDLTVLARRGQIKQDKLQVDRITNQYKECVQHYGSVQKNVLKITMDTDASKPSAPSSGGMPTLIDIDNDQDVSLLDAERVREQKQMELDDRQERLELERALYQEREDRMLALESDILDINAIMRDIGNMVHEQGEVVDSISDNIEGAFSNVESGNVQLRKASDYQRSSRKKMCIIVVILVTVLAVIAIILAVTLKKK